jgi:hypothetical protein
MGRAVIAVARNLAIVPHADPLGLADPYPVRDADEDAEPLTRPGVVQGRRGGDR